MENVVSLSYKNNKKDLNLWINKLESLGYVNDLQILNATDFGSSQARRRVFMLSKLNGKLDLPKKNENKNKVLNDILNEHRKEDFLNKLDKYKFDFINSKVTRSKIRKSKLLKLHNI